MVEKVLQPKVEPKPHEIPIIVPERKKEEEQNPPSPLINPSREPAIEPSKN